MKKIKKCIVMLSGGLDSRLAVKIMQEQGFEVTALFYKLPFGTGCCDENCSFNFSQLEGIKLKIIDCTKNKLLKEYLEILKKPKYHRGAGVNPCIDCRIFLFSKAKEYAKSLGINFIVTGEVLGERPMSQMKRSMNIIEDEAKLHGRILRPLSAKLLPSTEAEESGLVNRALLYDICGRRREKQIALAKQFNISYPSPAGGCVLCEKELKSRFKFLFNRGLNESEVRLASIGRHFAINNCWIVVGRNEAENKLIEFFGEKYQLIIPDYPAPSAIIFDECDSQVADKVNELIKAYSKRGSPEERNKFEEFKL